MSIHSVRKFCPSFACGLLVAFAACSDQPTAAKPLAPVGIAPTSSRVQCEADPRAKTVKCAPIEASEFASTAGSMPPSPATTTSMAGTSHIFGGQGQYINL